MTIPPKWNAIRNILCVRLDALGDVLMTSPAFRALKETLGSKITLLTSPSGRGVAVLLKEVDDVLVYQSPWMKATPEARLPGTDLQMIETLREKRFDGSIIFTVYSQSPLPAALLCHLAGIPLRLAHCRENPYQLLTHWVEETEPHGELRHEVRRQLDLVSKIGCHSSDHRMRLTLEACHHRRSMEVCRRRGLDPNRPWILIHPGACAPSRRYRWAAFAEMARILTHEDGLQIVLTGSQEEKQLTDDIVAASDPRVISVAGDLDLAEFAALIASSRLLISNNTGPVHIASAVGTPVVDLYALTNPQHTPWMIPHAVLYQDVPCRFCYKSVCPYGHNSCLQSVGLGQVIEAARSLFHGRQPTASCPDPRSLVSTVQRPAPYIKVAGGP